MPIYILKTRTYHTYNGRCDVATKAYKTLGEAMKNVCNMVHELDSEIDEWEDSSSDTGEYIVDLYGYGKTGKDNTGITLEVVKMIES